MKWLAIAALAACGDNAGVPDPMVVPDAAEPVVEPPLEPTYRRDVAPLLASRCAGCHVDGGVAPFPLTSYDEASALSEAIAAATTERVMPPWPADASGACGTFVEPRWLADAEIATLARWHETGAPIGDAMDFSLVSIPPPTPFTPAVEVASDVGYRVMPGPDEYRCFVVDPGLPADRFITAIGMRLDRADVVHHMQLYAAFGNTAEQSISQRDAADPEPGYPCDDEGVGTALRYVGVWAGGDTIRRWPDGTGIKIAGGHRLVVQLHYHNHGSEPVLDRSGVALELAETVAHEGRIASTQVTSFELPPQQETVTISTQAPLPVAAAEKIRGARIHMHGLGTSARMELVRDGSKTCVLDIPRWDVGWQLFYRFAEPLEVSNGDQIRIRCSYDTRSKVDPVEWGAGTDDEMCIAYTFLTD